MNPLGIKPENFTVVEEGSGNMVAFAQLQPLPAQNACEFRSMIVLPEHRYSVRAGLQYELISFMSFL